VFRQASQQPAFLFSACHETYSKSPGCFSASCLYPSFQIVFRRRRGPAQPSRPYFTPATGVAQDAGQARLSPAVAASSSPSTSRTAANAGFVDSYVREAFNTVYFPDQFTVVPHDGDKVRVADQELAWHALDSTTFKREALSLRLRSEQDGVWRHLLGRHRRRQPTGDAECPPGGRLEFGVDVGGSTAREAVGLFGDRRMVMDDCVSKRLTLHKGRNVIRGAGHQRSRHERFLRAPDRPRTAIRSKASNVSVEKSG